MKNRLMILVASLALGLVALGCGSHENSYDLQTGRKVSDGKVVREDAEPPVEKVSDEVSPEDVGTGSLSGSWGRVMIGAAQGVGKDNFFADSGYSCLHFKPDLTVEYEGVNFFKRYRAIGTYELKPDENIVIWRLTKLTVPEDNEENRRVRAELEPYVLGSFYGTFGVENGRRTITSSILMFTEGITWDWEVGVYRDQSGNPMVLAGSQSTGAGNQKSREPKDPVYGLFPHESGDFTIRAELTANQQAIEKLIIVPFFHFSSPDEKALRKDECDLAVAGAKKWLKQQSIPSSIPVEVRIED